jgi:hypothetical protein
MGPGPFFSSLAWRRLYGEKTVRKAERARFLSEREESEALEINGARPHLFLVPFIPWGKSNVFFNHIA